MKNSLNKSQVERFSRQLILKNIGAKGQKKIMSSKVLIVGLGGLGCPAAENLVRAGIGTIGLIDNDIVSLSNIHRQSLFNSKDIKKTKVSVAASKLKQINPDLNVCILEKGSEVGAHILSGNVFETRALDELIPDWKEKGAPIKTKVKKEKFLGFPGELFS